MPNFKFLLSLSLCVHLSMAQGQTKPAAGGSSNNKDTAFPDVIKKGIEVYKKATLKHLETKNFAAEYNTHIQAVCGDLQNIVPQTQLDVNSSVEVASNCAVVVKREEPLVPLVEIVPGLKCPARPEDLVNSNSTNGYCSCLRASFLSEHSKNNTMADGVREKYKKLTSPEENRKNKVDIIVGLFDSYRDLVLKNYTNHAAIYQKDSFALPESCKPASMISALEQASKGFASGELSAKKCKAENCAEAPKIADEAVRQLFRLGPDESIEQAFIARLNSRLAHFATPYGKKESSCLRSAASENLLALIPHPTDLGSNKILAERISFSIKKLSEVEKSLGKCKTANFTATDKVFSDYVRNGEPELVKSLELVTHLNGSSRSHFYQQDKTKESQASNCEQIKKVISSSLAFYKDLNRINSSKAPSAQRLSEVDKAYRKLVEATKLSETKLANSTKFNQIQMNSRCTDLLTDISLLSCADSNVLQSESLIKSRNFGKRKTAFSKGSSFYLPLFPGSDIAGVKVNLASMAAAGADCSRSSSADCKAQDLALCDEIVPDQNGPSKTLIDSKLKFAHFAIRERSLDADNPFSAEGFEERKRLALSNYCPSGFGDSLESSPECKNVPKEKKEKCVFDNFYASSDDPLINEKINKRFKEALDNFAKKPDLNQEQKDFLTAVIESERPHGSLGEEAVIQDIARQNRESHDAFKDLIEGRVSSSDLERLSIALAAGKSSSDLIVTPSAGELANQEMLKAFGVKPQESAATSASLLNRFIASPEIQKILSDDQLSDKDKKKKVEDHLRDAIATTQSELNSIVPNSGRDNERNEIMKRLDELNRVLQDQQARNDELQKQLAALSQKPQQVSQPVVVNRGSSGGNSVGENTSEDSSGFKSSGKNRFNQGNSIGAGGSDLSGTQGLAGGSALGRSVSSINEARNEAPTGTSLSLVVKGELNIPASNVALIEVNSWDQDVVRAAILEQEKKLAFDKDNVAVVEVKGPNGAITLMKVKRGEDNQLTVLNFTEEQLANTSVISKNNTQLVERKVRYTFEAMVNILQKASGGSN